MRTHAEMRALEQAYRTYCAFTGVNASDGERVCHAGFGMLKKSDIFGTEIDVAVLGSL